MMFSLTSLAGSSVCRDLEESDYGKTLSEFMLESLIQVDPVLVTKFLLFSPIVPLSTRLYTKEELKYANLAGFTYVSEEPEEEKTVESYFSIDDTLESALYKLSEGDDDVTEILEGMISCYGSVDADNKLPKIAPLVYLNTFRIKGNQITRMYEALCKNNIHCMIKALQSVNLGLVSRASLRQQITQGRMSSNLTAAIKIVGKEVTKVILDLSQLPGNTTLSE
jgi:hypothetical protein